MESQEFGMKATSGFWVILVIVAPLFEQLAILGHNGLDNEFHIVIVDKALHLCSRVEKVKLATWEHRLVPLRHCEMKVVISFSLISPFFGLVEIHWRNARKFEVAARPTEFQGISQALLCK
jgi:hypothetical protein